MNENNVTFGTDKIVSAINRVADLVKLTLGASGSNVILETSLSPYHIITNDGISIVNECHFDDPVEEMGASMMREVVNRANDQSGDGTTTAVVLAQAIIKEAGEQKGMEVMRSLKDCLPLIMQSIDDQTRPVTTEEQIKQVATISSESEELGAIITKIYGEIGKDGFIELDNARNFEDSYVLKEGITYYQAVPTSPGFYNDEAETSATYENPKILITDQTIATEKDWDRIANTVMAKGDKSLVFICDGIEPAVNAKLVLNKLQGKFNFLVIKAPTILKDAFFQDISRATGATLISKDSGYTLQTVGYEQLGTCDKIYSDKDETRFTGTKDLSAHIEHLKTQRIDSVMAERIKRLNTKVAVLSLSSFTATGLKYKKDKAEDAVNATRLAMQSGVVPGGGLALLNTSRLYMSDTIGAKIIKKALEAPFRQIAENAGIDIENKKGLLFEGYGNIGYDAKTKQQVDMFDAGIIDAASVTKNSVRSAIDVASIAITAHGSVTKPKQKDMMQFPMMPGMMG